MRDREYKNMFTFAQEIDMREVKKKKEVGLFGSR